MQSPSTAQHALALASAEQFAGVPAKTGCKPNKASKRGNMSAEGLPPVCASVVAEKVQTATAICRIAAYLK
jgi:hypothetical protein